MTPVLPPLLHQYRQVKSAHPDAILLFQVGDFYEMFYDDAKEGAELLELTLTSRDKNSPNPVPLCGVPLRAVDNYIAKLIRAGRNVAVCDQVEEPTGKGIVKREVTRVVTPGTVTEDHLLMGGAANYLAAACGEAGRIGLAWVDVSTGDFRLMDLTGPDAAERLSAELARIECRELITPENFAPGAHGMAFTPPAGVAARSWDDFDARRGERRLLAHFETTTLAGFGISVTPAVGAAGAVLAFLAETQKALLPHIVSVRPVESAEHMAIDRHTRRNLELTRRESDGKREGSLLSILDTTRTSMGSRTLTDWLTCPLVGVAPIIKRQTAVAWAVDNAPARDAMRKSLSGIADLSRLTARVAMGRATPRDVAALGASLIPLPALGQLLPEDGGELFAAIRTDWDDLADVQALVATGLADELPAALKDGGVIREGISAELDELRQVGSDVRGALARMEAAERARAGMDTLKIRHNNVFGYYIEITKAKLVGRELPVDYVRKQTLVNAERFITPDLKELESKILSASERIGRLEADLFQHLREQVATHVARLLWTAAACGVIDTVCALAEIAHKNAWVRPRVEQGRALSIKNGRHPVVEANLAAGAFVANDTDLSADTPVWIVTGPNMAGKSTYLRQVALICLLAQMGSYVPAEAATVGVVDRIFSRIGASDNLSEGLSTFMVEMTETAAILNNVTENSLVILDEIGRGTSTFDGLSIAWAVAERLHDGPGARTLFATHYHELTELAETRPGVANVNVQVREWNDEIVFLHKIVDGAADRSYGIQVARLAGLPVPVIERAREVLANLEGAERDREGRPKLAQEMGAATANRSAQFDLFAAPPHPALAKLKTLDLEGMTPIEALNALHRLKEGL